MIIRKRIKMLMLRRRVRGFFHCVENFSVWKTPHKTENRQRFLSVRLRFGIYK
jgi:hypothetical protein